jgi:hypothetical protein
MSRVRVDTHHHYPLCIRGLPCILVQFCFYLSTYLRSRRIEENRIAGSPNRPRSVFLLYSADNRLVCMCSVCVRACVRNPLKKRRFQAAPSFLTCVVTLTMRGLKQGQIDDDIRSQRTTRKLRYPTGMMNDSFVRLVN